VVRKEGFIKMRESEYVSKAKLEKAFEQIRSDMATYHRDHAYAEKNRARWIFLIIWLLVAIAMHDFFNVGSLLSLLYSAILVGVYRVLDGLYIVYRAHRVARQPLEPTFDTHVDLS